MVEEMEQVPESELPLEGVGRELRRAREDAKLSLSEMAEKTRISMRHLEHIEQDEFSELPARTYAFGFTRTYARALGLDENDVVSRLRAELDAEPDERPRYTPSFEPGDPAKAPPSGVIWASLIAVLILAVGAYAFYARFFAPGADPAPLVAETEAVDAQNADGLPANATGPDAANAVSAAAPASPDEVVFTALEEGVWVSFYEAGGRRLEQKLMAQGERFVVPADAVEPRVWTGRPDAFAITIGGQPAPKLSEEDVTVRDIPITADALRSRATQQANPLEPVRETGLAAQTDAVG